MKTKLLLSLFLTLALPMLAYSQATVGGVVTYYFNQYQGDKPDLGAKVLLVDSAKIEAFDAKVVEDFLFAKSYRQLQAVTMENHKYYSRLVASTKGKKRQQEAHDKHKADMAGTQKSLDEINAALVRLGADTDEKFEAMDEKATQMLGKIKTDNSSQKTVDGSGNYSFNVTPGTYYVYISSKNRTGLNLTEVLGMVYLKKVRVAENDSKDVSHNFALY